MAIQWFSYLLMSTGCSIFSILSSFFDYYSMIVGNCCYLFLFLNVEFSVLCRFFFYQLNLVIFLVFLWRRTILLTVESLISNILEISLMDNVFSLTVFINLTLVYEFYQKQLPSSLFCYRCAFLMPWVIQNSFLPGFYYIVGN